MIKKVRSTTYCGLELRDEIRRWTPIMWCLFLAFRIYTAPLLCNFFFVGLCSSWAEMWLIIYLPLKKKKNNLLHHLDISWRFFNPHLDHHISIWWKGSYSKNIMSPSNGHKCQLKLYKLWIPESYEVVVRNNWKINISQRIYCNEYFPHKIYSRLTRISECHLTRKELEACLS
jgi:hypothetical protein